MRCEMWNPGEAHTVANEGDEVEELPVFASGTVRRPLAVRRDGEIVQLVHDLKNPLATIELEMCLLHDKVERGDLKRAIVRVLQNVGFMDRLVRDLLDASAIEEAALVFNRARTDLRALVERVIDRTTPTRDRPRVHFESEEPVVVPIDATRIERVIANLVGNALKYSSGGRPVMIRLQRSGDRARLTVRDYGPGLSPEDMQIVFERFRRASTARDHDGNGLGLFVSKRIVEEHGGRMGVDSVLGQGCSFYFELPDAQSS